MTMIMTRIITMLFAISLLFTVSCRNDDPIAEIPEGGYENGFLVANEGNFGTPTAGISYISKDLSKIENNVFSSVNSGSPLGDVLQNIGFQENKAYFVLNNSNKIVIADRYSMKKETEITTEINQPKFIAFANNRIYVTNDAFGGDKYLSVYNISDQSFVKKITFTDAADRVVEAGGKIFVQNASFGFGNKITVIETSGNTVAYTITIPFGQITETIAHSGSVFIIAAAGPDSYLYQYTPAGTLVKIEYLSGLSNARNLNIEGSNFYFTNGNKIYRMSMTATMGPGTPLITVTDNSFSTLYGMNVLDGKIFTSDANGFTADSKISVYSTSGTLLKTFEGGRGTNGFYAN